MEQVILVIAGALLLFAAGVGFGYAMFGRQRGRADELQQELEEYRGKVSEHFEQTAEHFQTIGREYRALYQHMAAGATALCESNGIEERLTFDPDSADKAAAAAATAGAAGTAEATGEDAAAETLDASDNASDDGGLQTDAADSAEAAVVADAESEAVDIDVAADGKPDVEAAADADDNPVDADAAIDTDAGDDAGADKRQASSDDLAPDERARQAGGESAPAEMAAGSSPESSTESSAEAVAVAANGSNDAAVPHPDAELPVDDKASSEQERIYH